jgi:hypothetical protein
MGQAEEDIKVRIATPDDLDGIMELARLVNEENGVFRMNEKKVVQMLWPALTRTGGICGIIGNRGESLTGLVLLRISSYWYSDDQFLEEMCVFVHPNHRWGKKGHRARKLCEFAKKCSEELNMPLMIGVLSNTRTESKVKLYSHHFGEPAGAFFLYGIKTGEHSALSLNQ